MYEELTEQLRKTCWGESVHRVDQERRLAASVIEKLEARSHGCAWCNGEYHTEIFAQAIRFHSSWSSHTYGLRVNYCPCCGRDLRTAEREIEQ